MESGDVLTLSQAAAYLQTTAQTLSRQIRAGNIPAAKIGSEYRLSKTALDELIKTATAAKPKAGRKLTVVGGAHA